MKWMREHDIFLRALALLIALMTWIYVIRTQNTDGSETYSNVSLQIEGIQQLSDNGLTIISGADTTISVKVSGKRDRILQMNSSKISATVNVASITIPGTYSLNYSVTAEVDGLTVTSKSPAQVKLIVDRLSSRSVPVRLHLDGKLADGYELSNWRLTPDAISISGPETDLAAVDHAQAAFDITGMTESGETSLSYILVDADGDPVDSSRLNADTPSTVLGYTITHSDAVPLTVAFSDSEYLTQDMITYTIEPSSIQISGNEEAVATVHQIPLGTISLRSVLENNTMTVELPILLPNGVSAVAGEPTTATVTIETPGYTRSVFALPADSFPPIDGLVYADGTLELRLFGPEDALATLQVSNFTVTTSASSDTLTEGENEIPLDVKVNIPGIKLFGSYTVSGIYTLPRTGE